MNAPFILTRIKFPKLERKAVGSDKSCYLCNKKIKVEKGYYEFRRQWEDKTDRMNFVCHRSDCQYNLSQRIVTYKYKDVYRHSALSYY